MTMVLDASSPLGKRNSLNHSTPGKGATATPSAGESTTTTWSSPPSAPDIGGGSEDLTPSQSQPESQIEGGDLPVDDQHHDDVGQNELPEDDSSPANEHLLGNPLLTVGKQNEPRKNLSCVFRAHGIQ